MIAKSTNSENYQIDQLLRLIAPRLNLSSSSDWIAFEAQSNLVSSHFKVPHTTCTTVMSKLLFGLGSAVNPHVAVGVGTFVGYCFAWLLGVSGPRKNLQEVHLIERDDKSNRMARDNLKSLGYGSKLWFHTGEGENFSLSQVSRRGIDLLFIDIDHPESGKALYTDILDRFTPSLNPGSIVIAHDPCVPKFQSDFRRFHDYVRHSGYYAGPWIIPIDANGISILFKAS
jgi:predicted O-methyltransferase YrrM